MVTSTSPTTVTTTYYPGVTDQSGAQTINVTAGQTAGGVEIRMATAPAFLVSGVVVDTEGRPLEGAVVSVMSGGVTGPHAMSHTDARGRFLVGSLTNGTYHVGVASSSSGPGATMRLPQQITVTIADSNVNGVRLVLVPK
jgi:protocatechuate 3,4-dioxygenase beta subunit